MMTEKQLFCPLCGKNEPVLPVSPYRGKHRLFLNAELCQCRECGFIFMHPMPSTADLDDYYKTVWTTSDVVGIVYRIQAVERVRYITRHIQIPTDAQILDVGAGHGMLYDAFIQQGFSHISFCATDPSPENLERLQKRGIQGFPNIASLGNRQFDLVTICFVLEHIPDPVQFLTSIFHHVKPGGYVFIDLPERDDTFKPLLEPHVAVYTLSSLQSLYRKIGLSEMHRTGYGVMRSYLIRENDQPAFVKKLVAGISLIENCIYRLLPHNAQENLQRKKLYRYYKFDEEGTERWWIRAILKKDPR
jgi:SAM-dependent methyltransferase